VSVDVAAQPVVSGGGDGEVVGDLEVDVLRCLVAGGICCF